MKSFLISSIVELIIGVLAILAFIVLLISGENMKSWIITLILAIILIASGINSIKLYKDASSNMSEFINEVKHESKDGSNA